MLKMIRFYVMDILYQTNKQADIVLQEGSREWALPWDSLAHEQPEGSFL